MNLNGWRSPGRTVSELTHNQVYGIIEFLSDPQKVDNTAWGVPLQFEIAETIDVKTANTLRHIIGFMKSIGVIYMDGLVGGKVPNTNHCVSPTGNLLYSLISMEKRAIDSENKEVMDSINRIYQEFYAKAFLYWNVRDTDIHVARTILKQIKKYGYLDKVEWFIINTEITKADNEVEQLSVEKTIHEYRSGELRLTTENILRNENSYGYWTQILDFAGLIIKKGNKIYMGKEHPELIEAILANDFLLNLRIEDRYDI